MTVWHSPAMQKTGQFIPVRETVHFTPESFLDKIRRSDNPQDTREHWEKEEIMEVQKDHSPLVC